MRRDVALREKHVALILGVDVGNAPGVADDGYRLMDTGELQRGCGTGTLGGNRFPNQERATHKTLVATSKVAAAKRRISIPLTGATANDSNSRLFLESASSF